MEEAKRNQPAETFLDFMLSNPHDFVVKKEDMKSHYTMTVRHKWTSASVVVVSGRGDVYTIRPVEEKEGVIGYSHPDTAKNIWNQGSRIIEDEKIFGEYSRDVRTSAALGEFYDKKEEG
ncbi:hypothetical protein [Acinetobacter phage ABPH49]|nr:hypothetical protein [Acinetobacter phage ABPH49]